MLKICTEQKTIAKIRYPTARGGFETVDFPIIVRVITRDEWVAMTAELVESGSASVDEEGSVALSLKARNEKLTELLEHVLVGVPEGTKLQLDNAEITDLGEIRKILIRYQHTSRGIFDHYANLMNGEGRSKNS